MTRMPQPTAADRALRSERVTLDGRARADLFKSFMPVLLMLFAANCFITVLQDIKEDFLVKDSGCGGGGAVVVGICQGRCGGDTDYLVAFRADVRGEE